MTKSDPRNLERILANDMLQAWLRAEGALGKLRYSSRGTLGHWIRLGPELSEGIDAYLAGGSPVVLATELAVVMDSFVSEQDRIRDCLAEAGTTVEACVDDLRAALDSLARCGDGSPEELAARIIALAASLVLSAGTELPEDAGVPVSDEPAFLMDDYEPAARFEGIVQQFTHQVLWLALRPHPRPALPERISTSRLRAFLTGLRNPGPSVVERVALDSAASLWSALFRVWE